MRPALACIRCEDLSNIPDSSYFRKDLIVTDTVYAPRETVMMKQAKASGCERVYNGMSMMLFQALIAIRALHRQGYTGGLYEGEAGYLISGKFAGPSCCSNCAEQ